MLQDEDEFSDEVFTPAVSNQQWRGVNGKLHEDNEVLSGPFAESRPSNHQQSPSAPVR